jgi:uncharacterized membrane protein
MNQSTFSLVAGLIFLLIALAHLVRLVFGWTVSLADWIVPFWVSVAAVAIFVYLAYEGLRLSKRA